MNQLKTGILMILLTALLILVGDWVGGRQGMIITFAFAAAINFVSYWYSDRIVLAMYRAQPVAESEAPWLYRIVRDLTTRAQVPMPKVYLIPQEAPNAFATGRNPEHAAVAVTAGITRILDERELRAVLAHELGHVRNRDILISTLAATIAGAVMILARLAGFAALFGGGGGDSRRSDGGLGLLLAFIVAPIAALLIQLAISRSREYQADETGGELSGDPRALASALSKLQRASEAVPLDATPATSHLFIVNPLRGGGIASLFSTHPPVEKRIERLEAQAERLGR
jgi:heat shock protein HtpX